MSEGTASRLRRTATNLGLLAAYLLLILVLVEWGARVALRAQSRGKGDRAIARYTEYDPMLGWRKRPGARSLFDRREYRVEVVINGHGLRDPERGYQAPPGTFRVLALGDSFVEGYTVPLEQTATQVLERRLSAAGCPAEVVNGGTAAYSTDQEYLFYKTEGVRYAPRVVVLFTYFNDIVYNVRDVYYGAAKPRLVERDGRLELARFPLPEPPSRTAPETEAPDEPQSEGWALPRWTEERLRNGAPRLYDRLAAFGFWPPIERVALPDQFEVYRKRASPLVKAAWESTARILAALDRETRDHGARLLLVYVPSRMEVNDRDLELTRLRYQMSARKWDVRLPARRLEEIAAARGLPFLDLTGPLRAADGGLLRAPYFVHDGHWTPLGHRVVGEAVERCLRQHGWVPPCPRQGTARTPLAEAGAPR